MKIHFYINNTFPYGMAAAKRRLCYAKGLIANNNVVDVVICQKCFEPDNDDAMPQKGVYENIPYNYVCGKYKYKKWNKIMRALDYYLIDYIRSFFYAINHIHKHEIVYVYFYPIFLQILIILAAKMKKAKVVKETCEHPSALGNIHSKWHKYSKWFEYKFIMPNYDGFIAISRDLNKFVEKYKSKKAKCIIVPILVDDQFKDKDLTQLKNEYDVPYIIHTGTMLEQKDSISKILYAYARLKSELNTKCRLVFTGPHATSKCSYLPVIKKLGIEKDVDLLGLVSSDHVAKLQHFATMTIIYKSDNLQTRNCFPTKLGEMLVSGTPVITTTIGDANLYLKNEKSAFIFRPDDEDTLVEYIKLILNNSQFAKQVGDAGRQVALKFFNPLYQGKRISDFFKCL